MPSALEDDAFEPVEEISYNKVPTHILADQYSGVYIGILHQDKFKRFTRVDILTSEDYESEIGIYFEGVGNKRSRFVPIDLLEDILSKTVPDTDQSGNSPHCMFCKDRSIHSTKRIEWPFNEKFSIHSPCYREFQTFLESVAKEHKSNLFAAVL